MYPQYFLKVTAIQNASQSVEDFFNAKIVSNSDNEFVKDNFLKKIFQKKTVLYMLGMKKKRKRSQIVKRNMAYFSICNLFYDVGC